MLKNRSGFTLTELLVVIVIIGILAGLTIPKFRSATTRAKATEAKLMLKEVYSLQKVYYLENDVWGPSLEAIGFESEPLRTEGGNARYRIELTAVSDTGFVATATSVIDFDKDGNFNTWAIDQQNRLVQTVAD
ncbi:prepilin-type N-terminal cleavage/methylation domain-containing protein [bacterium]|nr:prepilin-type N-terminal cleavage/methylation domain-containing protein [bacterium]